MTLILSMNYDWTLLGGHIHIENFPQKWRYIKICLFATIVTPVTVLRAEQFTPLCSVFFVVVEKFQLQKFLAWAVTKIGLLRHNEDKSRWLFLSLIDLQYTKQDIRQACESCCIQVFGIISIISCTWKKVEISFKLV